MVLAGACALLPGLAQTDPRLKRASRKPERSGWVQVHLEGSPGEIGFQHGTLLAREIADTLRIATQEIPHETKKPWPFFRDAARDQFWPHIESEYREELQGIAAGSGQDLWDIVALNLWEELDDYTEWFHHQHGKRSSAQIAKHGHCSAFAATGSYTRGGGVVIGHNDWASYASGERWNIIFDIVPARGHRILMDGGAGSIHSGDDFGINSAGLAITETTIEDFHGWDPNGIPEFVRARKAMQYASSINDFARIMKDGNDGGYANDWLVADNKTGEIASLELGLRNVTLQRTRDGYFASANFPINPKLAKQETDFDLDNPKLSPNARRVRWEQLMAEEKGRIDVAAGQRFLADHYDAYKKRTDPNERTLCGHYDLSPRGDKTDPPFAPEGAVQNKVADSAMLSRMEFTAALGHACGLNFIASRHLQEHPEFTYLRDILNDMLSRPWTLFRAD
jgi:hypothetical protein